MTNQSGFIALISAIIISLILLTITIDLNLSGFLGRYNILDAELKQRSSNLAEACVDQALLNLARNPTYTGGEQSNVGSDTCDIGTIRSDTPSFGQTTIRAKAIFQKANTNLEVVANSLDLTVISWQECRFDTGPCN